MWPPFLAQYFAVLLLLDSGNSSCRLVYLCTLKELYIILHLSFYSLVALARGAIVVGEAGGIRKVYRASLGRPIDARMSYSTVETYYFKKYSSSS